MNERHCIKLGSRSQFVSEDPSLLSVHCVLNGRMVLLLLHVSVLMASPLGTPSEPSKELNIIGMQLFCRDLISKEPKRWLLSKEEFVHTPSASSCTEEEKINHAIHAHWYACTHTCMHAFIGSLF